MKAARGGAGLDGLSGELGGSGQGVEAVLLEPALRLRGDVGWES